MSYPVCPEVLLFTPGAGGGGFCDFLLISFDKEALPKWGLLLIKFSSKRVNQVQKSCSPFPAYRSQYDVISTLCARISKLEHRKTD